VDLLVQKSLNKNPELRYLSAKEMLVELKAVQASPALLQSKPEKSIVVLPFENISPDPEQEYFCDGMTEEIISDLSLVKALRVIYRSSAMTFKGAKKKVREIADEANVRYVLEGSVRKVGNNIRVTAQLIDASNDAHLWAQKYNGTLEDVFDIQEKVSRAIVESLEMVLAPAEERKIAARPLNNVQAYDCYLRARAEIGRWSEPALDRAVEQLEMASKMVGDNALLLAGLSYAYATYYYAAFRTDEETLKKAEDFARRAVQLDPGSAQGQFAVGYVALVRGRWRTALRHLQQALSLNPDDTEAMLWFVVTACYAGKIEATRPFVARLLEIDPLTPRGYVASVVQHIYGGNFVAALEPARTAIRLDPEGLMARFGCFLACTYGQRVEEFEPLLVKWQKEAPEHAHPQLLAAFIAAERDEEVPISDAVRDLAQYDVVVAGHVLAATLSMLGKTEEALKWLERGAELGFINYPFLSHLDPRFENLRRDPRSKELFERIKYEWEHFEV
jgi:non-specific serine/threonine protein kinase